MTVNVLISTYNGETYIEEQIKSILQQIDLNIIISIRDDGSTDNTIVIIESLVKQYPEKIKFFKGRNLGYAKSFLTLLQLADEDVDYYAYSDQDDVWLPNKLIAGIEHLKKINNEIALYASSVTFCDENLNILYINQMDLRKNNLKSDFVRHSLAGCTMIFTKELKKLTQKIVLFCNDFVPSHDFIISSTAFTVGEVYIDSKSYILHRRHACSVTSKAKGIKERLKTECKVVFKQKNENYEMAKLLLSNSKIKNSVNSDDKRFLSRVLLSKKFFRERVRLILDTDFTCGIIICDLETKFKILIGNY